MNPTSVGSGAASAELHEVLRLVRRHWWILLVTTVVALGAALYYTEQQVPTYWSEAKVLVKNPSLASTPSGSIVRMTTETEVAESTSVAALAAGYLGVGLNELSGGLDVINPPETEILVFRYATLEPSMAGRGAQAFAEAYLDFRRENAVGELVDITSSLRTRMSDLRSQLRATNDRLTSSRNEAERLTIEASANALSLQVESINQQIAGLTVPDALQVGSVVEPAAPARISTPNLRRNGLVAIVFGLGLGTALILLRNKLDRRVRDGADLSHYSGAATLAIIPAIRKWRRSRDPYLAMAADPEGPAAEAYRHLAANILFASTHRGVRTVLMTSPGPGEGKTSLTANLGVALARSGKRVLLISADFRRPRLHLFFRCGNFKGLSTAVGEGRSTPEMYGWTGIDNLRLLSAGPLFEDPSQLLSSPALGGILNDVTEGADIVLIDCAPVLAVADSLLLAPLVDAVVLLADAQQTSGPALESARAQLEGVDANILGAVLNNVTNGALPSYYRYQSYQRIDLTAQSDPAGGRVVAVRESKQA